MNRSRLNQSLKQFCPRCQAEATQLDSVTIKRSQNAELVHVRCRACQGSVVALLLSTGSFISSIGLITDLTQADVVKFQRSSKLTEDDLFALHAWLQQPSVSGDLLAVNR